MKILVTGGAGAIGRYVVKELVSHDLTPDILDIRRPDELDDRVTHVECDLMDLNATVEAVSGYDAVIHLAAIPHPFGNPIERVMAVNMTTCFNVLEAVRRNGIPRIIYAGSDSASGFGIHNVALRALYLPIDEAHPSWPHEAYSLSKLFGEEMVKHYARAYGIQAISLRYTWVWLKRDAEAIRNIVRDGIEGKPRPEPWFGCYIAPHDVAQACRLAVSYEFAREVEIPFEMFCLTADTSFLAEPTLEALSRVFDPMPEIRDAEYFRANPFAPPLDSRKAKRLLGFEPTKSWQTFDEWESAP